MAGPGAPPSARTSIRPRGTEKTEAKASELAASLRESCCGPGRCEGAEPPASGRGGLGQPPRPGTGRTIHCGRRKSRRLTCLMYMFAEDAVGPPGCGSARPRRLFPVRALGLTAGSLPPLPAPSAAPRFLHRARSPLTETKWRQTLPVPSWREPFSATGRENCGAENALLYRRRRDTTRSSGNFLFPIF